jgi:putative ABC transport system permease protein
VSVRRPPRFAEWLLSRTVPARDRAAVLGDLAEEHAARAIGADRWYRRQVVTSLGPNVVRRLRRPERRPSQRREREAIVSTLFHDMRQSLRSVRRVPLFAALVVLTLGLGIGANTIVFSVVDGLVLNPFPFPDPDGLVGVGTEYPRLDGDLTYWENLSPAEYVDIRDGARTLRDVVAWDMGNRQITVGDRTENLFSGFWWGDAFPTLGVRPSLGRGFLADEVARGDRVAILSHRVWRDRFGGDSALVGGRVLVNGEPYTLVGVMPPRTLIYGTELWLPMPVGPEVFPRQRRQFQVLARLADGATLASANTELETLARRTEAAYGGEHEEYAGWRMVATTWTDINVRQLRPAGLVLLGAVAFVLLLVCANVASLVLGRAVGRRRELAVRAALGAGRGRLVRQLLTESVVLALIGGVVGAAIGTAGVRTLAAALPALQALPIPGDVEVNARVLLFTALVSLVAGIVFGIVPALSASRLNVQRTLQSETLGATAAGARLRLQRIFVGVEVALALVLLVAGGLLVHSFLRLQSVAPGFDASNVLTMRLTLAQQRYDDVGIESFFRDLSERVRTIPGVTAAAVASQFPPFAFLQRQFFVEGAPPVADETLPNALTTIVSPGYFETLGVPLVDGRTLNEGDILNGPLVAVVNETAARRYLGGDAVGRRLRLGAADSESPWFEVVGVVGDTKNRGLDVPAEPELFASTRQALGNNQFFLLVRTRVEPHSVLPAIREQVRALDPDQPVYAIRTIEESFATIAAPRRLAAIVLALFGLFALALAGVGIYGVVSYAVTQRTREIGLRIALGAGRGQVRRMVVRQALVPVLIGAVAGMAGAVALGRLLASLLFDVRPTDPWTLAAVVALLLVIASFASWLPARRAARLSPIAALRSERG